MHPQQSLLRHALFGGLSEEDLDILLPRMKEEAFEEGKVIVKEGDEGDRLYFILSGSVEILRKATAFRHVGSLRRLAVLQAGNTFGEMMIIDVQRRSASVRALEPVTTLSLSHAEMYKLYQKHPKLHTRILLNLAREISRRLRKMDRLVGSSLYYEEPTY